MHRGQERARGVNRSMPESDVIPVLVYPDVRAAVAWLCRVFGFVEHLRIGEHRAQLSVGRGSVVVTGGAASDAAPARHAVMVRVADVDPASWGGVLFEEPA